MAVVAAIAPQSNDSSAIGTNTSVVADDGLIVPDLIHRGIVARLDADQQLGREQMLVFSRRDTLLEDRGSEPGAVPGAVAKGS